MGIILISILIAALLIFFATKRASNEGTATLLLTLSSICVIAGSIVGISMPISGFEEREIVKTVELGSFSDESDYSQENNLIYVSISENNTYTYCFKEELEIEDNSISGSNITIVEDDSCAEAKLVKYVRNPKKTFWTFAFCVEPKYEYIFYVPAGTVLK